MYIYYYILIFFASIKLIIYELRFLMIASATDFGHSS